MCKTTRRELLTEEMESIGFIGSFSVFLLQWRHSKFRAVEPHPIQFRRSGRGARYFLHFRLNLLAPVYETDSPPFATGDRAPWRASSSTCKGRGKTRNPKRMQRRKEQSNCQAYSPSQISGSSLATHRRGKRVQIQPKVELRGMHDLS